MESQLIYTGTSSNPKRNTYQLPRIQTVDRVLGTYELVEMILCELPLKDIARAQRICKAFHDVAKRSKSVHRIASTHSWLPHDINDDRVDHRPQPPFRTFLDFDNGPEVPANMRFFSLEHLPTAQQRPYHILIQFEIQTWAQDFFHRGSTVITPSRSLATFGIFRMIPLARPGWTITVVLDSGGPCRDDWRAIGKFDASSTLGDLYDWLFAQTFQ